MPDDLLPVLTQWPGYEEAELYYHVMVYCGNCTQRRRVYLALGVPAMHYELDSAECAHCEVAGMLEWC
jgi:hypothetical protein